MGFNSGFKGLNQNKCPKVVVITILIKTTNIFPARYFGQNIIIVKFSNRRMLDKKKVQWGQQSSK